MTYNPQTTRAARAAIHFNPALLDRFDATRAPWHESPDDITRALADTARRERLLAWVRKQIALRLTPREAQCIHLYYFRGMTYQQAGDHTNTQPSSVLRGVQRGLKKLRAARDQDPSWKEDQ